MTHNRELALEACLEFWNDYHADIEMLKYSLSDNSLMMGDEGIFIVATITPAYPRDMLEKFREILPREYEFRGEVFPVRIFLSFDSLLAQSLLDL
tara:strand:- start:1552 stop:1836 length:285 start_codon:yes stop_codon:yes gene_type:complete